MLFEETELHNDADDDYDDNRTHSATTLQKNSEQYSQNKLGSLAAHV